MVRTDQWLAAWGLSSLALGGASLIVPLHVVELGGTAYTLGVMAALAAFIGVPGALVAGSLADRRGNHRTLVVAALAAVTLALASIPVLPSIAAIIVANAIIWLAFAAAIPVLTLLVVADAPESTWSARIARLNKFQGVGWALGLLFGAVASGIGGYYLAPVQAQRWILWGYAVFSAIGLIAGGRWLPYPPAPDRLPEPRRVRRAITRAARFNVRGGTFPITPVRVDIRGLHPRRFLERFTPPLALYFFAVFLGFAGFSAFFAPLPAFLHDATFADGEIFTMYVISSLAAAACFGWVGRIAATRGALPVYLAGLAVRGIAFPAVGGTVILLGISAVGVMTTSIIFVLIGISWALIIVTAGILVTQLAPRSIRSEALGIYSALMAFAGGVGSIVGGRLAVYDYLVAFMIAGGLVAAGAIVGVAVGTWRKVTPVDTDPLDAPSTHLEDRP